MAHRNRFELLVAACIALSGCGSADSDVDPADLSLRDLLGLDPSVGARWDVGDRASARRVVSRAFADEPAGTRDVAVGLGTTPSDRVLSALAALDHDLAEVEAPPLVAARIERVGEALRVGPFAADLDGMLADPRTHELRLVGWDDWPELSRRVPQIAGALAAAADHPAAETVTVEASPRAPVAAAYLPEERTLLLNPILVASLDPEASAPLPSSGGAGGSAVGAVAPLVAPVNPYDFYGSVEECAEAERIRCQACIAAGACDRELRDSPSGLVECQMLDADMGRGYLLYCANLSLAIATVGDCVQERSGSCPIVETAGNQLSALQANSGIVDDAVCLAVLDGCLSDLFGEPNPGSGGAPPPREFRGCWDCNTDCNAQCNKDGADTCNYNGCTTTCDNQESGGGTCHCDADDSGSDNDCSCQKDGMGNESCTCGDGGDACTCTKDSEGNESCSCGEPSGGSSGGGDSETCDGCGSGSGGGGGSSGGSDCGSCSGSGGTGGGSGGSDCGSCGGSGGGSGGGKCGVARSRVIQPRNLGLAVTVGWALLPVGVLLFVRWRVGRKSSRGEEAARQ